jgi:hypothetical protein
VSSRIIFFTFAEQETVGFLAFSTDIRCGPKFKNNGSSFGQYTMADLIVKSNLHRKRKCQ